MALKKKNKKVKKNKVEEKRFDLEESVEESVSQDDDNGDYEDFSTLLPDDKTMSSSDDSEDTIILQTYVQNKKPKKPESVDKLVLNSIELVESGYKLIPWIQSKYEPDSYIDDCIQASSSGEEIGDLMESSDVLDLQDDLFDLDYDEDDPNSLEVM